MVSQVKAVTFFMEFIFVNDSYQLSRRGWYDEVNDKEYAIVGLYEGNLCGKFIITNNL